MQQRRRPSRSLLYVEDDPELGPMTAELLSESYRVDLVHDAETAIERSMHQHYEVFVVDRRLPGRSGLDFIAAVRRAGIRTPALMLTALGSLDDRITGLDGGADDYLVKPFAVEELLARLRALTRQFDANGERRELGDWSFVPEHRILYSPTGERISLTETENRLIDVLSSSPEHVFGRDELLSAVFGPDDTPGAVDTYVHYVRKKTSRHLIETVRSRGYRIGDQP